jgi:hypothetical protein
LLLVVLVAVVVVVRSGEKWWGIVKRLVLGGLDRVEGGGKREADGMEKATNMLGWMDGRLDGLPI